MKPWMLPLLVFAVLLVALVITGVLLVTETPVPNELWGLVLAAFAFLTGSGAAAKTA